MEKGIDSVWTMSRFAEYKIRLFVAIGMLLWSGPHCVVAQAPTQPGPFPDSSLAPETRDAASITAQREEMDSERELSAGKLVGLMRSNPELMVEVKSLVAEQAQQQGRMIRPIP